MGLLVIKTWIEGTIDMPYKNYNFFVTVVMGFLQNADK